MATGRQVDYVDSGGVKHSIQEYGRNIMSPTTMGNSLSFLTEGVYIDGRRWAEYDDIGIGNPLDEAKKWIEEQIESRSQPQP